MNFGAEFQSESQKVKSLVKNNNAMVDGWSQRGGSRQDQQSQYLTSPFCEITTKLQKKEIMGVHIIVNGYTKKKIQF